MPRDPSFHALAEQLAHQGARDLVHTVTHFRSMLDAARPQSDAKMEPKAPKITRPMARIHWSQQSALDVHRLHRAIGHQYAVHCTLPSSFKLENSSSGDDEVQLTELRSPWEADRELQLLMMTSPMHRPLMDPDIPPGTLVYNGITRTLFVRTAALRHSQNEQDGLKWGGRWLAVKQLQMPGCPPVDAQTFVSMYGLKAYSSQLR
jgi:hypothetical protein